MKIDLFPFIVCQLNFTPDAAVPEKQNIFFGLISGSGAIKHWQTHFVSQSHFYERNINENERLRSKMS